MSSSLPDTPVDLTSGLRPSVTALWVFGFQKLRIFSGKALMRFSEMMISTGKEKQKPWIISFLKPSRF